MTESHPLARRIGRLIRTERERRGLSQAVLADRANIDQAALSRLESGRRAATTAVIERVLAALGCQMTVDVESLDAEVDALIAANAGSMAPDRLIPIGFMFPLKLLSTAQLGYRFAGTFGAFLHGVPVKIDAFEIAITPEDAEEFAVWLGRIPNVLRCCR